jgi:hypothetical protein
MGKIAQPLRVALTGTAVSPSIDKTLWLLGRERSLERIAPRNQYHDPRRDDLVGPNLVREQNLTGDECPKSNASTTCTTS